MRMCLLYVMGKCGTSTTPLLIYGFTALVEPIDPIKPYYTVHLHIKYSENGFTLGKD